MSNYAGPETREKGRIETWNPNTNLNQRLKLTCPAFHRPPSYFLHRATEMRSEFVRKHLRIRETLIRTTQGVGWGRVRQRFVSGRSIGVCWVMRRGLEDILRELRDRGRMQNLRLCQQEFRKPALLLKTNGYTPTTLLPGGIDGTHARLIELDGVQFC